MAISIRILGKGNHPSLFVSASRLNKADWQSACDAEALARGQLSSSSVEASADAARAWWSAASNVLDLMAIASRLDELRKAGNEVAQFDGERRIAEVEDFSVVAPEGMLRLLSETAGDLAAGKRSKSVEAAIRGRKGNSGHSATARDAIGWATIYLRYAHEGKITDRHPNKTVRDLFGRDDQTVRDWAKLKVPSQIERRADAGTVILDLKKAAAVFRSMTS